MTTEHLFRTCLEQARAEPHSESDVLWFVVDGVAMLEEEAARELWESGRGKLRSCTLEIAWHPRNWELTRRASNRITKTMSSFAAHGDRAAKQRLRRSLKCILRGLRQIDADSIKEDELLRLEEWLGMLEVQLSAFCEYEENLMSSLIDGLERYEQMFDPGLRAETPVDPDPDLE
jgi:hypothetical protein